MLGLEANRQPVFRRGTRRAKQRREGQSWLPAGGLAGWKVGSLAGWWTPEPFNTSLSLDVSNLDASCPWPFGIKV